MLLIKALLTKKACSIIYRKGAIHRTEVERPFLAVKGFDANLVQFLPPYHVIISNMHIFSFTCTNVHLKRFYVHGKLEFMKAYEVRHLT